VPVNSWLPPAHPVAPTNISALLSAVIVNLGIYGIVRVNLDLAPVSGVVPGLVVLAHRQYLGIGRHGARGSGATPIAVTTVTFSREITVASLQRRYRPERFVCGVARFRAHRFGDHADRLGPVSSRRSRQALLPKTFTAAVMALGGSKKSMQTTGAEMPISIYEREQPRSQKIFYCR
jgi:hypothetical protein